MGLKQKIFEQKNDFYKIFDDSIKKNGTFITANGRLSYDECIERHLDAWISSRIYGTSAALAFYAEDFDDIILIDKIAKIYFKNTK